MPETVRCLPGHFRSLGCWHNRTQAVVVLKATRYTTASDVCLLGGILRGLDPMQQCLGPSTMSFKQLISQSVGQAGTAMQLLSHPWMACQGLQCRVAGAQLNERYVAQVTKAGMHLIESMF